MSLQFKIHATTFAMTLALTAALSVGVTGCANLQTQHLVTTDKSDDASPYVVLGEQGQAIARVITQQQSCPSIVLDGQVVPMDIRAAAATVPQRATISPAEDSKPSVFPVLSCEKVVPPQTHSASIAGQLLPLPKAALKRVVVIGDTGCRLKATDSAYQDCNNPQKYPFAQIAAQAAAWQPDLVVHVGDFLYRETKCPDSNPGCKGSPWGYGWDAWNADFFAPANPLLKAAPWAIARGNHESCTRGGQGWWRFLDVHPMQAGRDCNDAANDNVGDYSDPYAVPLGGDAQLIMLDTSNTPGKPLKADDIRVAKYRDLYQKADALSQQAKFNIGVNHQPVLGFAGKLKKDGSIELESGNKGLQSVFASLSPVLLPPRIHVMLSGHVHLWQQVSFATPHATQIIAGFSGTEEDTVPMPASLPAGATPAVGAVVNHFSSWVEGFGFMTLERTSMTANQWLVQVWNKQGKLVNSCHIDGKDSDCDVAQVKSEK